MKEKNGIIGGNDTKIDPNVKIQNILIMKI